MALGIGEGALFVSGAAVIITVLKTKPWTKSNGNGKLTCDLHSGIEATLKYLTDGMDEVREDIKELLKKG